MIRADGLATGASLACAVHCAALPLLVGASGCAHGHPFSNPWVEGSLVGAAGIIGYATLGSAFLRHRRPMPLALLTAGLALLIAGHSTVPHGWQAATVLTGALLLLAAQVVNRRCPAPCCASGTCLHDMVPPPDGGRPIA